MANDLKNLLPMNGVLAVEVIGEDSAQLDPYFRDDAEQIRDDTGQFKLPQTIGILPIRNAVAYPGTVTPLAIG